MISDASEAAIDQIVASCNGDIRGALKALLLVNEQLEAELAQFYAAVASTEWPAAATPSTRAFGRAAVDLSDATLPSPSMLACALADPRDAVRGHNRAFGDGRTGQLGVVDRFVGSASEPDISADLTVDDGIARDNLAFAGRAIADHPESTLRESAGSGRDHHRAGQQQWFHGFAPVTQSAGNSAFAAQRSCLRIAVAIQG